MCRPYAWFLKIAFVRISVCVCLRPQAIKNYSCLNSQSNKPTAFQFLYMALAIDTIDGRAVSYCQRINCICLSFHSKMRCTLLTRWSASVFKSGCAVRVAKLMRQDSVSVRILIKNNFILLSKSLSLSTVVLNSRDWREIVWLLENLHFKNQPCNRLYSKKLAEMHW